MPIQDHTSKSLVRTVLETNCDAGGDVSMNCKCRRLSCFSILLGLASIFFFRNVSLVLHLGTAPSHIGRQVTVLSSATAPDYQQPQRQDQHWQRDDGDDDQQSDDEEERRDANSAGSSQQRNGLSSTTSEKRKDHRHHLRTMNNKRPAQFELRAAAIAPNATLSACLLIKDDNDILPEWLAYHYHTMNLRNLIVAVDPSSSELPSEILQKWRLLTDLKIREWTDSSYMPAAFLKTGRTPPSEVQVKDLVNASAEAMMTVANHRYRQRVFLSQCMRSFRQDGLSWVIHIDTDEFVVASKLLRQMNPEYVDVPDPEQPGSLLRFIQQVVQVTGELVNYPCISMLRVLFGSQESSLNDQQAQVPPEFNGTAFETLRWRYHGLPHNRSLHGNPKVIIDVGAIPGRYFEEEAVFSIHRPIKQYCPRNSDLAFSSFRKQPVGVNHYLGSWERYSGRSDNRRSRDVYDAKAGVNRGRDDGYVMACMRAWNEHCFAALLNVFNSHSPTSLFSHLRLRPWLRGFLQNIGVSVASDLLGVSYLSTSEVTAVSSPAEQSTPDKTEQLVQLTATAATENLLTQ